MKAAFYLNGYSILVFLATTYFLHLTQKGTWKCETQIFVSIQISISSNPLIAANYCQEITIENDI